MSYLCKYPTLLISAYKIDTKMSHLKSSEAYNRIQSNQYSNGGTIDNTSFVDAAKVEENKELWELLIKNSCKLYIFKFFIG